MRKKLFLTVIVICLALLFTATIVACTGDGNTDETPGNTDVTPGGEDVTPGGDDVTPGGDDTGITPEGEFTFTDLGNDQWSVAKYNGNRAHVVIPSTYKGGAVVAIGDEAFGGDTPMNLKLKSVVIPDSVTTIGVGAFGGCIRLTSITIGEYVTAIGEYAFFSCMGLTAVEIPDSVTTIGEGAFGGCIGLTSITIGEYVTAIGEHAFEACYKLVEIYNKSNLNLTAGSDDYGGIGLCAKNIYNEGNESKLSRTDDGYIFYYDGTDAYLMGYCGDEINLILPDGFTAYNGEEITSYKIHMAAFAYNMKITSVVISDTVDVIGEMAFAFCPSLVSITIGASVTDMADLVFGDCFKLIEVYNKSDLNITAGSEDNGYVGFYAKNVYTEEGGSKLTYTDDGYIFYYDGSEGYLLGYCGDEKELTLPDSFTAYGGTTVSSYGIYQYAFSKYVFPNYDLTSVDISNSVTTIGDSAFDDCIGLTSVLIPDSVMTIGDSAFYGCAGLTFVAIPDSVTAIGNYAFADCTGLASVVIPDSVTAIGNYAFGYCTGLTSVTIGESVTTIGDSAFDGCTGLASVVIPDSVTAIGNSAFYGCAGLISVTIPDSVITIGNNAFGYCTGLTSVTIGESVTTIWDSAFNGCHKLIEVYNKSKLDITAESWDNGFVGYYAKNVYTDEGGSKLSYTDDGYIFYYDGTDAYLMGYYGDETELTLPDSFTAYDGSELNFYKIYQNAFYSCDELTSVAISDSVTAIGDHAFYGCIGLTFVAIPDSVTAIGNYAFYDCIGLTSVLIPDSVMTIGDYAFYGCTQLVEIENGVSYVDKWAVDFDDSVAEVTLRNGTVGIANNAFSWSAGLTAVTIAESVTTIGEDAFAYCSNLQEINWNAVAVNDCNGSIFRESGTMHGVIVNSGTTVNFGDNVQRIPAWAFSNCYGLTSVNFGDSVTVIGEHAFENCYSLTSITIVESVTTIEDYAFYYCNNIIEVYNKSDLNIIAGSEDNGHVGYYAQNIYTNESESKLTYTDDGYMFYYDGTDAYLMGYRGDETNPVLPDSFTANDGKVINSYAINDYAFQGKTKLTSVTIGDSVTAIGNYAFYGSNSLNSVTIGDSVTVIGHYAFYSCNNLASVAIGESVTKIDYGAFEYCNVLTSVYYAGDIAGWCDITFERQESNPLNNGGNLYIDNQLVTDLVIPDTVTEIKSYAFFACTGLTSVSIPDSVTKIGMGAFSGCTQVIEIENGVSYVDKWAIDFDDSVAEVVLRSDTVGIANNAFSNCNNLTSIVIPDKVTTIGRSAFDSCYGLTSITIGASVTTIEYYGFYRCDKLIEVYNKSDLNITAGSWEYSYVAYCAENVYTEEGGSKLINTEDGYLFYGDVNNAYLVGYYGDEKELTLPDSFTAYNGTQVNSYGIYQYAFYHRDDLTSVVISDSVTSIGESAFSYCSGLTSVTIGESVTAIGNFAFSDCTGLTSMGIPDSVISIKANAFSGCTQIFEIENGVSYVDKWVINCDDSVTEIIWRNDIFGIADCAFQDCAVTSVSIPDSVVIMGSSAFAWCDNLTSIVIPDSVTTIGNDAFYNCYMLNSVTFEDANGWQVSLNESFDESTTLSATDLSDPDTAAQYMTGHYKRHYWRKV